ncbi:aspartic proteinase nepenthesin-1-like [Pistacia vera]|uniref:aspartic proteinase nepenthesin-1-like n=1 Tax=Pistacia vera TaxID=55513 RepID=UPI001263862F|nr:aspartic proteinase nepenthesin-1-like [Pistacia vera]
MAGIGYLRAATVFLSLFILPELSFAAPNPSGFRLRLIPRDYPGSPLNPGNLTELERERFINYFNGRGTQGRLHSNTANSSSFNDRKFVTPLYRDTFYYIGEFSIGSEPANVTVYLVIDTTSSLIWMQCQPCKNCYHQQLPMYNSQASKSYSKVSCEDPYCSKSSGFECVNDECVYKAHYDEGGSTNGILSRESFTFQTDNKGGNLTVPGVVFGCSNDNQNFPQFERDGIISGVMGLSLSPESLFGQLSNVMQNVFSYCIVPFSPMLQHPSILRFGKDVHIPNRPISTVRYYIMEENYNYYLTLNDISVGESRIGFPPEIFLPNNSGIFIDPGTPITQLVADSTDRHPNVLHYVLLEFQAYFDSFGLVQVNGTGLGFDLCYNQTADFKQYPTMTYHFVGGDWIVAGEHVIVNFSSAGFFCVGLTASPKGYKDNILGAVHQQNKRVIHNGNLGAIQFYPERCDQDTF